MTPREISREFKGAFARIDREHNERMLHAYTVASLSRAKKMPALEKLLRKKRKKKVRQTWDQQLAIMRGWAVSQNDYVRKRNAKGG